MRVSWRFAWARLTMVATLATATLIAAAGCSSSTPTASSSPSSSAPASASSSVTPSPSKSKLPVTHPTVWVCRPGMANNPCLTGLDATVLQPSGASTVSPFAPAKDPKIDCFYVYPTVSQAKSEAQPLAVEPAVVAVTKTQAGRFESVCRLFAPVYRQFTRSALNQLLTGKPLPANVQADATADVVSAWHDYLNTYNDGRGVVLLGHSQGASQLISLLRSEIDGDPAQRALLVSAIALGGNLLVPIGKDVGGDLQNIPACRSVTQHGCVVAYSTFSQQPPANAFFGRAVDRTRNGPGTPTAGMQVLCVNPGALAGGSAPLHPYVPTKTLAASLGGQAGSALPNYPTGFLALPDRLTGQCRSGAGASWLQVSPAGTGPPLTLPETLGPRWGLHLVDFSVAEGDLVDLVTQQAATWS